jgi:2-polyprenyl-6-methoxyphenol hydroxylase-like FAD-dependent oxidoreductase
MSEGGLIAKRGKDGLWRVVLYNLSDGKNELTGVQTYGDPKPGLTDEEYLERRAWHFEKMLPGHPKPDQYCIEQTNIYNIHNRCADAFRVGRVLLVADAAHVCNP